MNDKERRAMIEALEEAAGHLDLDWTDDSEERKQGKRLSDQLRKRALRLHGNLSCKNQVQSSRREETLPIIE